MKKIKKIIKQTNNPHLNMYRLNGINRKGVEFHYYMASRAKDIEALKMNAGVEKPDGVIIYSVYGPQKDRVVLIKQYRYPLDDYIYEFPAGLVDEGENYKEAGVRELKEETGLTLIPLTVDEQFQKPYFMTIGMTDESCATVYGYAEGELDHQGLEDSEDIEVILADKAEVKRILKEENVTIVCSYMLMHFLSSGEEPFEFLKN